MSVAVQEDTGRARSLGRRLLAIVDRTGRPARTRGHGWVYLAIVGLALIAGAVSLRLPTTPNYDPWVWVIWGREIVHGQLSTTGGPTLKPLALVFTTIVAPFGSAAPNMWVAIARAGALTAVALTFLLTTRLARIATAPLGAVGWALALAAGLAAAGGVLVLQSYIYVVAQGYSEGLLLTVLLLAVLRHLDGAPRQTQALLFAASLDRPEMWPLFIVYGLWLWRVDPGARRQIACLAALILPIWLLPDLIGSGSLLRGAEYASYPRGAGTTACPFCSEVTRYEWPLVRLPFRIGVVLAFVPAVAAIALARGGTRTRRQPQRRLDICLGVLLVAAIASVSRGRGADRAEVLGQRSLPVPGGLPDDRRRDGRVGSLRGLGVRGGVAVRAPGGRLGRGRGRDRRRGRGDRAERGRRVCEARADLVGSCASRPTSGAI